MVTEKAVLFFGENPTDGHWAIYNDSGDLKVSFPVSEGVNHVFSIKSLISSLVEARLLLGVTEGADAPTEPAPASDVASHDHSVSSEGSSEPQL